MARPPSRRCTPRQADGPERIYALLDEDSFVELDALARHRSTNFGLENNRPLATGGHRLRHHRRPRRVHLQPGPTVFGGSLGEVYGEKIVKVQELAVKTGRPLIGINDGRVRAFRKASSRWAVQRIFRNNILASGVIPQISLIMGAAAVGTSTPRADRLRRHGRPDQPDVHHRPDVIKTVTGEDVTMEELGGGHTHMAKSGTAHYVASGEQDAFDYVRELLSYLPPNNFTDPPRYPRRPEGRSRRT
ncbi:carboxyl transferase domain protein [Mycobacterium kansasii]|uniref:Carboxyl transferase domain protein n=1 Tax=Mycobacterium kansasii TaxID=1768 RepID=A0A1V3WAL9_MYCKA|nr:carboxyl transferase domain protein [Mycobacterium kansasii]